ncbi:MAG: hypothetical protein AAB429_01445 [Patescibacteria group bacterium]
MKFRLFWRKVKAENGKIDPLSYFLLHASDEEKQRVFLEAAKMANKDQRELVERSKKLEMV